jgi:glucose/mannose-6-phosphate isomerase
MTITNKQVQITETRVKQGDPSDMLGKTLELAEQIERGRDIAREFLKSNRLAPVPQLDWFGLGGSAVSGDLLQAFGYESPAMKTQVFVRRHMRESNLPRLVCSYSGNTVEAVRALSEVPAEQIWLALSSGGEVEKISAQRGIPFLKLPGGYPPRGAIGFSLGAVAEIFEQVLKASPQDFALDKLREDAQRYRKLTREENPALDLAVKLVDRTPVIYTCDGLMGPALAFRMRAQFSENSKVWSHSADLPELAHNEVEAMAHLGQVLPPPLVIFLGKWAAEGIFSDPRPGMEELFGSQQIASLRLDPLARFADTPSRAAQGLRLMLLTDAATVYLALLRADDPMEIPKITRLKNLLSGA